jgi:lipoate-protein ligase A
MSIDMALLDRAERESERWLRLYRWEPHCLSFGRHEPAMARYDVDRITALGIDTVRRPTGGRSVWHARELTYAIASPCSHFGSLRNAYLEIHQTLREALSSLGIEATLASRSVPGPLDSGPCFSRPAGGEVLVSEKKVIGSAQVRRASALLQHGSILLHDDQPSLTGLLRGMPEGHMGLPGPAHCLGKPVRLGPLTEAISKSARARWPGAWEAVIDGGPLLADASRHHSRFRSPAWTWAR